MVTTTIRPFVDLKLKVNTYIVEASSRNGHIDSLYVWLFLRVVDHDRHGSPTGRVFGFKSVVRQLAQKMRRSEDRMRRRLREAERHGYCTIDADTIWIPSRYRLTMDLVRQDKSGLDQQGRPLPDPHVLGLETIMEVSVSLAELWDSEIKTLSHSRLLDIVRQRITQAGLCRESFAKLVGMDRRSTARMDKTNQVSRGFQYALVTVEDLVGTNTVDVLHHYGERIIERYNQLGHLMHGRGGKIWLGRYQNNPSIYTQIGIKYDTTFQGKLKPDTDVIRTLNSSANQSDAGCLALQQSTTASGREPLRGEGTMSDSQRGSITRILNTILTDLRIPHHPTPQVHIVDGAVFGLHRFAVSESPNTEKQIKNAFL